MPVVRLGDLAEVVVEKVCKKAGISTEEIKIKKIGLRPGEKMFEELMTEDESQYAVEYEDMFAIIPLSQNFKIKSLEAKNYRSDDKVSLTKLEIISSLYM